MDKKNRKVDITDFFKKKSKDTIIDEKIDNHCNDVLTDNSDDTSLSTTKSCVYLTPEESSSIHTVNNSDYACFEKINEMKGRKLVRCKICCMYPNIVLLHVKQRNHIPPICTKQGTIPRSNLLKNHLNSSVHIECLKQDRFTKLNISEKNTNGPIDKIILIQNQKLATKISEFLCTVYNDAKRGTYSAWSWPSNEVAHLKRNKLNIFGEFVPFTPNEGDLQYVTPINHREFLKVIVEADRSNLTSKLNSCIAVSLRVDGSVDHNQIDNIHVLVKVVTSEGNPELIFLSFEEPESRGVRGYYDAVKKAVNQVIPWDNLIGLMSSIVTDGASINSGDKNGLWSILEKERADLPLIKVWCAVHRTALAWEKLTANVVEVRKIIETCVSISNYFHQSGLRTKELKQIANENNCKFMSLPCYFEVRWTEFTHSLCLGILKNWYILVKYFTRVLEKSQDLKLKSVSTGFLKFLTNYEKLKLLCFITDLGYLYSRFQKQLQADNVTIYDLEEKKNAVLKCLNNIEKSSLMGGWEETLNNSVIETKTFNSTNFNDYERHIQLKGFTLHEKTGNEVRRKQHHLYITDHRSFCAIRNDSLKHLINYINERLDSSEWSKLKPLEAISPSILDDELKICHNFICSDFELVDFISAYREAASVSNLSGKKASFELLKILLQCDAWKPLSTSMARVLAAKPHSADVERLISYYNIIKTNKRSSLAPDTIKDSLYIKINMPTLSEFNPLPATKLWLNKKSRHNKTHPDGTKQRWFRGVFPEAEKNECDGLKENLPSKIQF